MNNLIIVSFDKMAGSALFQAMPASCPAAASKLPTSPDTITVAPSAGNSRKAVQRIAAMVKLQFRLSLEAVNETTYYRTTPCDGLSAKLESG